MKKNLAVVVGKIVLFLSRTLRIGGGAAAPGYYALKVEPDLLNKLIAQIPKNIIITGTNGKTTTAKLLTHFVKTQGLKIIRNTTGSNLERGIVSALIAHSPLSSYDLGIWEIDEAAFNTLAPKIRPEIIVFLNVSRDQLDRYGEVDSIVGKWRVTLQSLPKSTLVILNADDENIASLVESAPGKTMLFGMKEEQISGEIKSQPKKGRSLNIQAYEVITNGFSGSQFKLSSPNYQLPATYYFPLPGLYHVYDALAAISSGLYLKLDPQKMAKSCNDFSPAFGRVEKIKLSETSQAIVSLIKNPTGATQVLNTLAPSINNKDHVLLALNDELADGTDVSWIWDVPFEELQLKHAKLKIIISGNRAVDLAIRLKYAGFDTSSLIIENNLSKALERSKKGLEGTLFIFPTYTALLSLQKLLAKQGLKRHYWEEK